MLRRLSVDADPKQAMAETGTVAAIVDAIIWHPDCRPVRVQALRVSNSLQSGFDRVSTLMVQCFLFRDMVLNITCLMSDVQCNVY